MNTSLQNIGEFFKSKWGIRLLLIAGGIGIGLILLSEFLPAGGEETPVLSTTTEDYVQQLEQRLTGVVGSIHGVGKCRVMITLENGVEYVYASEEKAGSDYSTEGDRLSQTDDSESSIILVQTAEGYEGLLVTELQPTVKGVVVVCEGGDDERVQARVTEAVTAVLNITAKRVCVVAGNGE